MIARTFGLLRILSRLERSQKEVPYYIHKQRCHTTPTYLTLRRKLRSNSTQTQCWNCGSEIQNSVLFCNQCSTLQKPDENKNYFDILCIKQGFEIEDKELTTKYRKLQNVLHPDRFSVKSAEEREISEQYSALVNRAYSTLQQPLARGLYILHLQGINLHEDTTETDPRFLAKIMETNEELAEAQHPDDVRRLENDNTIVMDKLTKDVAKAFHVGDTAVAKQVLVKMKYYSSIAARIKDLKQRAGIE